jgi:putative endonuclease
MENNNSNKKITGDNGEDIACRYLEENGYVILERNKHFGRASEIDIIAKLKNKLVFVEVKTRKSGYLGSPFEAVTRSKYEKILKGVHAYLSEHPHKDYRIDAVGITLRPSLKIEHERGIRL